MDFIAPGGVGSQGLSFPNLIPLPGNQDQGLRTPKSFLQIPWFVFQEDRNTRVRFTQIKECQSKTEKDICLQSQPGDNTAPKAQTEKL